MVRSQNKVYMFVATTVHHCTHPTYLTTEAKTCVGCNLAAYYFHNYWTTAKRRRANVFWCRGPKRYAYKFSKHTDLDLVRYVVQQDVQPHRFS